MGNGVWRLRHTKDPKTGKWFNIFREVDTSSPDYKDTGTDEHGFAYYDTPIDWKRDYEAILNEGVTLPMNEFKRFQNAAQDFTTNEASDIADEAMRTALFSKLRGKRRMMEAGDIKDPEERARQLRMAGAEFTGGEAYGRALGRNFPKSHGDVDQTRGVADKYATLGLIQGMLNQEPGADTRMKTLEPLLVGYIRNATPEQMAELNSYANMGNLDAILNTVGKAADSWGNDPNMQQYAFASAANRWNSPNKFEDIAAMGGPAQQPAGPGSQQTTMNAPYISQPQLEAYPTTNNPNWGPVSQQQNPQNPQQPQQPQENQFTGPTGWAAPIGQQQAARTPQQQGTPLSATPGNFGNSLSSFATMYGGGVLPSIQTPTPGMPPEFPEYGELLAAATFQQAYMTLFKAMYDRKKFYQQQADANLISRQDAQNGINDSEKQFDILKGQLYKNEIKWKEKAANAKLPKLSDKRYEPVTDVAYTSPVSGTDEEKTGNFTADAMHDAYGYVKDQWELSRASQALGVAKEGLNKLPDLRRKLVTELGQRIYDVFHVDLSKGGEMPPESELRKDPTARELILKIGQLKAFEDAANDLQDMFKGTEFDKSIPKQEIKKPMTPEQSRWYHAKLDPNKPHHWTTRFFKAIGLYGLGEKGRRRRLSFLRKKWLGLFAKRKKPDKVSEKEWQAFGFLEKSMREYLGPERFQYVVRNQKEIYEGLMSEPMDKNLNSAYERYVKWLGSDEEARKHMIDSGELNEEDWRMGAALYRAEHATSKEDLADYQNFKGIKYGQR